MGGDCKDGGDIRDDGVDVTGDGDDRTWGCDLAAGAYCLGILANAGRGGGVDIDESMELVGGRGWVGSFGMVWKLGDLSGEILVGVVVLFEGVTDCLDTGVVTDNGLQLVFGLGFGVFSKDFLLRMGLAVGSFGDSGSISLFVSISSLTFAVSPFSLAFSALTTSLAF